MSGLRLRLTEIFGVRMKLKVRSKRFRRERLERAIAWTHEARLTTFHFIVCILLPTTPIQLIVLTVSLLRINRITHNFLPSTLCSPPFAGDWINTLCSHKLRSSTLVQMASRAKGMMRMSLLLPATYILLPSADRTLVELPGSTVHPSAIVAKINPQFLFHQQQPMRMRKKEKEKQGDFLWWAKSGGGAEEIQRR